MPGHEAGYYTITEAATRLSRERPVTAATLRYIEKKGLVRPRRTEGGHRLYDEEDLARLRFVLEYMDQRYVSLDVLRRFCAADLPAASLKPHMERILWLLRPLHHRPDFEPLTRAQLAAAAGLTVTRVEALEAAGLIVACNEGEAAPRYDEDALELVRLYASFEPFGVQDADLAAYLSLARAMARAHLRAMTPALLHQVERQQELLQQSTELVRLVYHQVLRQMSQEMSRDGSFGPKRPLEPEGHAPAHVDH